MKIYSAAPTRISLFGGGTDVSPYCDLHGGCVISMAVNLRQKVLMDTTVVGHVLPERASHEFVKIIFSELNTPLPSGLFCEFDGIIESGMGSSASAAVALIGAINKQQILGMTLSQIAEKAWDIEVNKIGLFGGKQDQYAAAYGGVNAIEFKKDGVSVHPLARGFIEPILPSLALFYTGMNRKSAVIQEGFKELSPTQIISLQGIKKLAYEAVEPIANGDFKKVGQLLDRAWELKKRSNKDITNGQIDAIYAQAKSLGAYGGKILGAGGGGFILFIVDPEKRAEFIKNLGIEWWDFSVDWNGLETRIIP